MTKGVVTENNLIADPSMFNGFNIITGFSDANKWFAIQAVGAEATLSATCDKGDNLSSTTILDSSVIYGVFNSITVTSGKVLAYIL